MPQTPNTTVARDHLPILVYRFLQRLECRETILNMIKNKDISQASDVDQVAITNGIGQQYKNQTGPG